MNQVIPLKLLGAVAFIMIFTYTATGILYVDYDSELVMDKFDMGEGHITTLSGWLEIQWNYAYREFILAEEVLNELYYDFTTVTFIYNDWIANSDLFDIYDSGIDWFWHSEYLDEWNEYKRNLIRGYFHEYLETIGYEIEDNKGMIDAIADFFGAIPDAISRFYDVMSFNIPKMPNNIRVILNIIFIPLWIILTIGIAPLIIKALQAVASFVDAIIPF